MKYILKAALSLSLFTIACSHQSTDVSRCYNLTITQEGLVDTQQIETQKKLCVADPLYEICMHEGLKEYQNSGTLPPNDHVEAMMVNC